MTKAELVGKIAEKTGLTKIQADQALNILVETVIEELKNSGGMVISGLGSFNVIKREARMGHNPKTLAPMQIPASNSVKFKSAKALKDAVN